MFSNNKGMIKLHEAVIIVVAIAALFMLVPFILTQNPIIDIIFKAVIAISIYTTIKQMVENNILVISISLIMIYFFVIEFPIVGMAWLLIMFVNMYGGIGYLNWFFYGKLQKWQMKQKYKRR